MIKDYSIIKEEVLQQDPLIKLVKLSDLELTRESLEKYTIKINGVTVKVSPGFFRQLANILGIDKLYNTFGSKDREYQYKLIGALKSYVAKQNNNDFYIIGNASTAEVTNIINSKNYNRISNDTLFTIAETLLNDIPNISVQSIDRTKDNLSINIVHDDDFGIDRLGPDEFFRFGLSLRSGNTNTFIDDYMLRLSCDNGLVTRQSMQGITLNNITNNPDTFRTILYETQEWAKNRFIPEGLSDKINLAMNTKSSYYELEKIYNLVAKSLSTKDFSSDDMSRLEYAVKDRMFPHLADIDAKLKAKGYDPKLLNKRAKGVIPTGRTIWDLVNDLTFIGSNKTVFDFRDQAKFKKIGGDLYLSDWDLQYQQLALI